MPLVMCVKTYLACAMATVLDRRENSASTDPQEGEGLCRDSRTAWASTGLIRQGMPGRPVGASMCSVVV